ncbi:MAG TPA: hypothetical protein VEJ41_04460 [Candidatus Acidoferrales bacterium]|nr:hypothetical protein [Candidatus Acidoferrales bacterium]
MKRKSRKTVCVLLTEPGQRLIAVAAKRAMYSQGFPGHPPSRRINFSKARLVLSGEDAMQLAEIAGWKFVPPPVKRKKRKSKPRGRRTARK